MERSSESPTLALNVEQLSVRYGQRTALDRVSLAVPHGAVYALLGRNGAGKSSLVRCVLGQQRATGGDVALLGGDAWRHRHRLLARVGVVPEEPDAPPAMTAAELGRFSAQLYPSWRADFFADRLRRFAVPSGLAFARLSKGQRAQVALALALAPEPELLVLDDPTLGLDVVARRALFEELVDDLAERGTTVLLTTHDLDGVEGIASRVGILDRGRLLVDEELETLKGRFRLLRFRAGTAGSAAPAALRPLRIAARSWGTEIVVADFAEERLPPTAAARPEVESLSLEEIFLTLLAPSAPSADAMEDRR